ncbi:MAG: efflux RND transporter permease subunit [Fervidobacterium sp.]
MEKFAELYVKFILRHANKVLIFLVIISAFLGIYAAFRLRINADITGLAPKDDQRFQDLIKYTSEKVTSNTLLVAVFGIRKQNPDAIAKDLKELFERSTYVNKAEAFDNPETLVKYGMLSINESSISESVNYYQSLISVEPRTLADFRFWRNLGTTLYDLNNYIEELVKKSGIKKYYLISPDNDLIVMNFSMSKPMSNVRFVTEAVEYLKTESKKIEKKYDVEIKFSGGVMSTYEANKQASKDFTLTTIISIVGIVIILILGFGSLLELFILFTGLIVAMVISLGIIALLLRELNIVTTFVNAMLLGLGIDYAMYIVTRIQERFHVEGVSEESIVKAFVENFRPSFISMLTTALAFFTMLFSPSNAIKQMGISVSIGIAIYFFVFNLIVPVSHQKLLNKFKRRERDTYVRFVDIIRRSKVPYIFTIFATIIFTLFGVYSIMNFSYTTSSLIASNSESQTVADMVSKKFGSVGTSDVVIALPSAQELEKAIADLKKKGIITSDFSILSFIHDPERIAQEKSNIYIQVLQLTHVPILEIIFKKYGLYESFVSTVDVIKNISTTQDLFNLMQKDVPSLFYKDINGKMYLLSYITPSIPIWEGNNVKKFFNSLRNYRTYGYTALFYNIIEELISSTVWVFGLVFLVELIVLYIDFRNFKKSLNIMLLTVLNALAAFGISYLVGIKTTFITFIVLPIFLGIGVDSLVEIDHSVKFGRESIIKTEKAVIMSILTTVVSFASFLLAGGKLLREFGFVTSAGLVGALFISIFWYLNVIDPRPGINQRKRNRVDKV